LVNCFLRFFDIECLFGQGEGNIFIIRQNDVVENNSRTVIYDYLQNNI
jgi:hypothetical protein